MWSALGFPFGFNCVDAVRWAGYSVNVFALPVEETPQNFGITLTKIYLGPFEDDTDIFYSDNGWFFSY
jgi:hypothetical protein